MNVIEPIFNSHFSADTYACIKQRGIHQLSYKLRDALKDIDNTKYCLKLDVKKFYPSIDIEVLKRQLRRKFKDPDLLWLMDDIINSSTGLPIGNLTSQSLANFYLTGFDKYLKQELKVKGLFRYCDDIAILSGDKDELRDVLHKIDTYLQDELNLQLKSNYQIFPVDSRGVNIAGYVHFHGYTLLRPSIKHRMIKMLFKDRKTPSISAYYGWCKHGNCINLMNKYNINLA